ncbi:TIGR02449 family protein [Endozoicomonas sp. Mp262]|uniref:TIGR02449 family protein n=1 Tax=Endozoicomonas sp. Mp262 TaxID=2919499 RepID=UPI0021DB71DB
MNNPDFNALDQKIEYLVALCQKLKEENKQLRYREKQWRTEREQLVERNEAARTKVEAMITHLKALEHES